MTQAISLNPFNGERIAEYPYDSALALEAAVAQGSTAFKHWRKVDINQRASRLIQLAAERVSGEESPARV